MELHFIFNPCACHGKSIHLMNRVERYLKWHKIKYNMHRTQYAGHATEIAAKLTANKNRKVHIFSIGGDGTANEVLNGIDNFENTIMSIIPAGSGNDFVKNFKADYKDPIRTLKRQLENESKWKYTDFIDVNDKVRCINVLGCGIDTDILERYNAKKWFSARTRYKMATIEKVLVFSVHDVSFKKDNNKGFIDREVIVFLVGNGNVFGGSIITNEHSKIDDGLLTITYLRKFPRAKTIPYMTFMLKHGVYKMRTANWFHCKELVLKMKRPVYQVDGQLKTDTNVLKIKCVTKKLKFVA